MSNPLNDPPFRASANPSSGEEADALFDGSAEPTDDSPTIISKTPPEQRNISEHDFSGSLRGRRLAHFELIEPIGVGGMAAVLRARDTQLDRQVALKILPPEMASDPENVRRFHREARSAARLDHENIARVFFCGEDQRLHFIAFEFVEGENLRTILERRGRLPVGEALNYMLQVAAGLAHAASRGVVHRDIKPSNIIITPNGRAKLVDMGLARSLEPQHDKDLTQSGVTLGTFDYISPEQALEPRDADVRSDIYSLGCTFYHLLTGHPPVPEGTAAKKLHHHQHVKPADPRQFVADLPDEAAFILDRMIAKQPRDRYQSPEHLVHHLYLAARKLGVAAEAPEGVLAVEAALPTPPAGRPILLTVVAVVAVIALIFLLDASATPQHEPPAKWTLQPATASKPDGGVAGPGEAARNGVDTSERSTTNKNDTPSKSPSPRPSQETPCFDLEKPTRADLAKFLGKHKKAGAVILKLDSLDLGKDRDDRQPDLIVANRKVTILPRDPKVRPTIRDAYKGQSFQGIQTSLTIKSEICTIENIRFVVNQTGAGVSIAALRFVGTHRADVRSCEFIQTGTGNPDKRMTSVLAESEMPAELTLTACCFLGFAEPEQITVTGVSRFGDAASGGQDAVTRRGPIDITLSNCVFGPHAAVFRLEDAADSADKTPLHLEHCSVLMGNRSAVFDVADRASARIVVHSSLFSLSQEPRSAVGAVEESAAVLLRQKSALSRANVRFEGSQNRYHRLDGYWLAAGEVGDFNAEMRKNDVDSRTLQRSPWQAKAPLRQLEKLAIRQAFAVNLSLPALRLASDAGRLVGVERVLDFSYLDNPLPAPTEPVVSEGHRQLIVKKCEMADSIRHVYPTLDHALPDAQPGDVILLQIDGEMKLDAVSLAAEGRADLTIRGDRGFHPVLTLNDAKGSGASALFTVHGGRLKLENLEIRLRPREEEDEDPQSVVVFSGDGECRLKNCLVTLDRPGRGASLAGFSEKRKPTQAPRLSLENCFVRGQGCLMHAWGGQFAELSIEKSLIALSGSLLHVESNKDQPTPLGSFVLHLHKCTTYLGGHLVHIRSLKDLKSVAKVQCRPEDCLFLPAGNNDRALIRLEGPESQESGLTDKLSWSKGGRNAYGCFATFLEQQPLGVMPKMPVQSDREKWISAVSSETDSAYNVKLLSPPAVETPLGQLLPSAFGLLDKSFKNYGADIGALEALPMMRAKPTIANSDLDLSDPDDN